MGLLGATDWRLRADDFPPIKNSPSEAHLLPMDARQAARTMSVPEGFKVQLFAAEPDVQNPIAIALDQQQRVWIAENYTYSDRSQRFDLSLRDRVLVFQDTNSDGLPDKRQVFTDQVQMLTSVEVGRGGVWLMCPPQLLFIPDADGNAVPDGPAQVILDGFEVAQDNYHNFANGLRWGVDGWLYGRCGHSCPGWIGTPGTPRPLRVPIDGGLWRYHPDTRRVEVLCHGTVNPWGHDWDEHGELFFINTVIGHLWHMLPGSHFKESFGESMNPDVYQRMDMIADHYHFDTRGAWSDSRDGRANDLGGGHAHIGCSIYKGDRWPTEYRGRLFTLNMHGRRLNVERLERFGAGYVGRHEPDLMIAADPFFRAIDIRFNTGGDALIIDWSDTGECHESTGVHRTSGRIYCLQWQGGDQPKQVKSATVQRLETLWSDYRSGRINDAICLSLLEDPDEHIRVWAIRLLSDHWPLDTIMGPMTSAQYDVPAETLSRLIDVARSDSSGLVQLTLASVLQRLPVMKRRELASAVVTHARYAEDRQLPLLVWYGLIPLANVDPGALIEVASRSRWPLLQRFIARKLAMNVTKAPEPLSELLALAPQLPPDHAVAILSGMEEAFQGWRKVQRPAAWDQFVRLPHVQGESSAVRRLNTLFGDGLALDEIRSLIHNTRAELAIRQRALETLIEARPNDLRQVCESLLDVRVLNRTAVQGLALVNDPAVARLIAQKYRRFQPEDRPFVIETLVSRIAFAVELLKVMEQPNSPIVRNDLNAFHARQILSLNAPSLNDGLARVWGQLRETPAERLAMIDTLRRQLTPETLGQADLKAGRELFNKSCSMCHQLYGQGKPIGPDLTGSQRTNLDYLLENIVDPSAVVGKDYRMSKILTVDGRVVSGLILRRSPQAVVVQTQSTQESIPADEIERIEETTLSPMPAGVLETLAPEQIRDLIAYLMHPSQV